MKVIKDIYEAGKIAEGLGHYVRIATVRLLKEAEDHKLTLIDLIQKLKQKYGIEIKYGTYTSHVMKLVFAGICKNVEINGVKGLELVRDVEVVEVKK